MSKSSLQFTVSKTTRYYFERVRLLILKRCLAKRFTLNNVFVVTSSPRSGSTLLGQALTSIPRSCLLFEPLHLRQVPEAEAADFSWRTHIDPDKSWPQGENFLKGVFKGNVVNNWTAREMSVFRACLANKLVVKFVRANRLLPWMCNTFHLPSPVFLIRHPCAVVASQLGFGWKGNQRPQTPSFLHQYPRFHQALEQTNSIEEFLASLWALDQLPALLTPYPHHWTTVTYEELILQPERTLSTIFENWKLDVDLASAISSLKVPSSVVSKTGISGIEGWRTKLSDRQIEKILRTVNAFGINFYSHELEPDYDLLRSATQPEAIKRSGIQAF